MILVQPSNYFPSQMEGMKVDILVGDKKLDILPEDKKLNKLHRPEVDVKVDRHHLMEGDMIVDNLHHLECWVGDMKVDS